MSRRLIEVAKEHGTHLGLFLEACRLLRITLDRARPQYTLLQESTIERLIVFVESDFRIDPARFGLSDYEVEHRHREIAKQQKREARLGQLTPAVLVRQKEKEVLPILSAEDSKKFASALLELAEPGPHPLLRPPHLRPAAAPPIPIRLGIVSAAPDLPLLSELVAADTALEVHAVRLGWNDEDSWPAVLRRAQLDSLHAVLVVVRLLGPDAPAQVRTLSGYQGPIRPIERFAAAEVMSVVAGLRSEIDAALPPRDAG